MSFKNTPESKREENGITYYLRDDITVGDKVYERLAIQTHFIQRRESYIDIITKYVKPLYKEGDVLSISEKIISMCQDNVVEKKDIKISFWAKFLSKFASSNSSGIAMDEPYKLQLAINIAGLPRILWASFCSCIMKLFGKRGTFYRIAGHGIGGIDGFYQGSSFEVYHDIALLNPRDPDVVCNSIQDKLGIDCILVDANDINVELFAKSYRLAKVEDTDLIARVKDNPAGQSDELTPLILVREKKQEHEQNCCTKKDLKVIPEILEEYRDFLESTKRKVNHINFKRQKTLPWESKCGGCPYLETLEDYPMDQNGRPMMFLAQINFDEMPPLDDFPTTGILQFYIEDDDCFSADGWCEVRYIPKYKKESLINENPYEDKYIGETPFLYEGKMMFTQGEMYMTVDKFAEVFDPHREEGAEEKWEAASELCDTSGCHVGGYPHFVQWMLGEYERRDIDILLLQLDEEDECNIEFGDSGNCHFFISKEDLKNKNFNEIFYHWECY